MDNSFEKNRFVHNTPDASNATDWRTHYSTATSQGEDFLDILNTLSNNFPVDDVNAKEITSDLLSEKFERPKIWSISDILGNTTTDTCSNEISPNPAGELSEEPNHVPAHLSAENQVIAGNGTMNPINNLNANNCIGNQSQLSMSTPYYHPSNAPFMSANSTVMERGVWMENGTEFLMLPGYGNRRWYVCSICNLPCSDKNALNYHHYVTHVINQTVYRCPLCSENYWSKETLHLHLQQRHPNQCFFCRIEFQTPMHLMNHIILCHSNMSFMPPS